MREIIWGSSFKRAYKYIVKKNPALREAIQEALQILRKDPFTPQLETHKLKGKLSGSWACNAGYDLRIVFDFIKTKKSREDAILLSDIGTHEEVY